MESEHEIVRLVRCLNQWFTKNARFIPRHVDLGKGGMVRCVPVFRAVEMRDLKGWRGSDLEHLFKAYLPAVREKERKLVYIDLLIADKNPKGQPLNEDALLEEILEAMSYVYASGRHDPRMLAFAARAKFSELKEILHSFLTEIQMRRDRDTPLPRDQRKSFEDLRVALELGQTPLGSGYMFEIEPRSFYGSAELRWYCRLQQNGETAIDWQPIRLGLLLTHKNNLVATVLEVKADSISLRIPGHKVMI